MKHRIWIVALAVLGAIACDEVVTVSPSALPRNPAFRNGLVFAPEGQPCGTRPITPPVRPETPSGRC
jgi:hypothetical protein